MRLVTWQNQCAGYLLRDGSVLCPACALDHEKDADNAAVPALGVERCDVCRHPLFPPKERSFSIRERRKAVGQ